MPRGKELSLELRLQVIELSKMKMSLRQIAGRLSLSKSTVQYIQKSYLRTNSLNAKRRGGSPKKTSTADDRALRKIVKESKGATTLEINKKWSEITGKRLSLMTCRRRLHALGYSFNKTTVKPLLTEEQRKNRLKWAQEHITWTQEQWNHVIFSDEAKFDVGVGEVLGHVIQLKSEDDRDENPYCTKKSAKFGDGLMVWGCMSSKGVGNLHFIENTVNAVKYQNILRDELIPSAQNLHPDGNFIFQQDCANFHTAQSTKTWLADKGITVLPWPLLSPDLNPIGNLWDKVKEKVKKDPHKTKPELKETIKDIWGNISQDECQTLINSMNNRLQAVITANGV